MFFPDNSFRRYARPAWLIVFLILFSGCARFASGPETAPAPPPPDAQQVRENLEAFDQVWETIRDKHWETDPGGNDWNAVRDTLRPRAAGAASAEDCRAVIREMLGMLGQSHFAIFPADVYEAAAGVDDPHAAADGDRDGSAGLSVGVIDGLALVTRVEPGSSAEAAGVVPGWEIVRTGDRGIAQMIENLSGEMEGESSLGLIMARSIETRTSGAIGDTVEIAFRDAAGDTVDTTLVLGGKRGHKSRFGNLPANHVWHETRTLPGGIGYFAFNYFLDLVQVMPAFNQAMESFRDAPGVIIDLRGNPGGLGAMAMGMAGWFIPDRGHVLGTMSTRAGDLKFAINPKLNGYGGPLAILIDESSASTSEIMAGGLKDLGRARIFGTRSAGAALPSYIDKLPNGDGFQYAVANYVSGNGEALEGVGVEPDLIVSHTRESLLQGKDPALEAAIDWINDSTETTHFHGGE